MRALPPPIPARFGHSRGWIGALVAGGLAWLAILALAAGANAGAGRIMAGGTTVAASDLVGMIRAGNSVELSGVTVLGDLDLRSVDHVTHVVRCTDCAFSGSVVASNVIFDRIVDLSGATIAGGIDLSGAVLHDAFLLASSGTRPASVASHASFSLTTFAGRAAFDGTAFGGDLDLRGAQLQGPASFADAEVIGAARFDGAIFTGDADFASAPADPGTASGVGATATPPANLGCPGATRHALEGAASFAGTTFGGKADFGERCFGSSVTFSGAQFDTANFGLAAFVGRAVFDGASVGGDVSFRAATFFDDVSLQQMLIHGTADFDGAVFHKSVQLFRTTVLGLLSLQQVLLGDSLGLGSVQLARLHMSLDDLDHVRGPLDRERALTTIESTARAAGDLNVANDAAFLRSSTQSSADTGIQRLEDLVAEQAGGYLVKPFYPLRAIVWLFLIGTGIRTLILLWWRFGPKPAADAAATMDTASAPPAGGGWTEEASNGDVANPPAGATDPGPRQHPVAVLGLQAGLATSMALKRVSEFVLFLARSASASLHAAFRGRPVDLPAGAGDRLAAYGVVLLAGAEWLAYKLLAAVFLIGLANSNPTFKQLLEAVSR